ncbi:ABC transporter permease (plasmid) [Corynebacterium sp. S7]
MNLLRNDLLKFRRSHVWAVVVLVPLIAVAIGAANYAANSAQLDSGWGSYFSQILLFYGLIFMTVGIAIISAAAWRFEHRGHNWHTMMTSTRSAGSLVASKMAAVVVIIAVMQVVLLVLALVSGLLLSVPGQLPWTYVTAILVAIIPGVAVASWQSFLSMVIRNFAAPIAIALVLCVISVGALGSGVAGIEYFLPPALVTTSISLGSTAVSTSGSLDVSTVATVAFASMIMATLGWLASAIYLRNADVRL